MKNVLVDEYSKEELEQIVYSSKSMAEVVDKLGYSTRSGRNSDTVNKRLEKFNISTDHFEYKTPVKRTIENVFCEYSTASQHTLKQWFLKQLDKDSYCAICGQGSVWNDKELPLILDHINGNKHDNRMNNLRLICPNCNQQLATTKKRNSSRKRLNRSRNNANNKEDSVNKCRICGKEISNQSDLCFDCSAMERRKAIRPPREILKNQIRTMTFVSIGKMYGVTDNAIKKWCDAYNLPRRYIDIRKIPDEQWDLI